MIAFSKNYFFERFNPVLGSSYKLKQTTSMDGPKRQRSEWKIEFNTSNHENKCWYFSTIETAQQALEWLDHLYGVKFIPSEIIELENKEKH